MNKFRRTSCSIGPKSHSIFRWQFRKSNLSIVKAQNRLSLNWICILIGHFRSYSSLRRKNQGYLLPRGPGHRVCSWMATIFMAGFLAQMSQHDCRLAPTTLATNKSLNHNQTLMINCFRRHTSKLSREDGSKFLEIAFKIRFHAPKLIRITGSVRLARSIRKFIARILFHKINYS